MLTFIKENNTKIVSPNSSLVKVLLGLGWIEQIEKEVKNGKSSKSSDKPDVSLGAE